MGTQDHYQKFYEYREKCPLFDEKEKFVKFINLRKLSEKKDLHIGDELVGDYVPISWGQLSEKQTLYLLPKDRLVDVYNYVPRNHRNVDSGVSNEKQWYQNPN